MLYPTELRALILILRGLPFTRRGPVLCENWSPSPTNHEKEKGKFQKIVLPSVPRAALRFGGVFPLSSQKFYTLRLCCLAQIVIERSEWELAAAGEFQICCIVHGEGMFFA
jgi:hypothetical protein